MDKNEDFVFRKIGKFYNGTIVPLPVPVLVPYRNKNEEENTCSITLHAV